MQVPLKDCIGMISQKLRTSWAERVSMLRGEGFKVRSANEDPASPHDEQDGVCTHDLGRPMSLNPKP